MRRGARGAGEDAVLAGRPDNRLPSRRSTIVGPREQECIVSNRLGIGIVGAGVIGKIHANALKSIEQARVVAIAEPREGAGRSLADSAGARWYPAYEEMLAEPDVDVVVIATPSGMHPDQAVLAARAGKHIITEKPMAITRDGLDRMIAEVDAHGVEMAVVFQNRFSPDMVKLKRAVEAGVLGTPVLGGAQVHWHRTQAYYEENGGWRGTWELDGGGSLMNQSIHTIDLLQWIMGGVAAVSANFATLNHDIETEDTASASVVFRSGALGTIQGTTSAGKDWPVKVEIVGTGGKAVIEAGQLTQWDGDSPLTDDLLTATDRDFVAGWQPDEPFGVSHERQLRQIVTSLLEGETPPVPAREARKAVEIILAIYESARDGRRVALSANG
jgi:predicted dehydrogenase